MADVFFSHVEEDFDLVQEMANALEAAGYSTWFYERDALPGMPHLLQTRGAIEAAQAIVLVISADSLGAHQVTKEVRRGADAGKDFVPVLREVPYDEFRNRAPDWESAIAGAVALRVPADGSAGALSRLVEGLRAMGVAASGKADPVEARLAEIAELAHSPGQSDAAERGLRLLVQEFPDSARAHHALGGLCNRTFRHADAVAEFERAIAIEPDDALLHWDLALTYQKVGRPADAAASLQRATALGLDASRQRQALALLKVLQQGAA